MNVETQHTTPHAISAREVGSGGLGLLLADLYRRALSVVLSEYDVHEIKYL